MGVRRRQAGLTALVAASAVLAFVAVAYHVHGLAGGRADGDAFDVSPPAPSISVLCPACTLVHISAASPVGCVGPHVPFVKQHLKLQDAATLPHDPVLCSHATRAPPAPHDLWA